MLDVSLGILTRTCSRGQCMESWINVLSVIWKKKKKKEKPFHVGAEHKDLGFFFLPTKAKLQDFP